jgi:peroxiredoxin
MLIPRTQVPKLTFPLVNGGTFDLEKENPKSFNLIVFYRGLHCPLCAMYTKELGSLLKDYQGKGVEVVVVSSDTKERAEEFATKVGFPELKFGYGLSLADAKQWGLYISEGIGKTSIGIEEPAKFSDQKSKKPLQFN